MGRTQELRDTQEGLSYLSDETGGFAVLNNFGVAPDHLHVRASGCIRHGAHFGFEHAGGKPSLKNESDDNCFRPGAGDCEIVDCAVDR